MDWSECWDVESDPEVMSGLAVVKGTRVPADSVIEHADAGYDAERIATDIFPSVPVSRARRIIAFAREHAHPA